MCYEVEHVQLITIVRLLLLARISPIRPGSRLKPSSNRQVIYLHIMKLRFHCSCVRTKDTCQVSCARFYLDSEFGDSEYLIFHDSLRDDPNVQLGR